jgi:NAD(P)-dependent dehydrogenase (short-subunit alcohol dehydrogenase family)
MDYLGNAFDVANTVAFFVSHSLMYITGQNITIDGGLNSSTGIGSETVNELQVRSRL